MKMAILGGKCLDRGLFFIERFTKVWARMDYKQIKLIRSVQSQRIRRQNKTQWLQFNFYKIYLHKIVLSLTQNARNWELPNVNTNTPKQFVGNLPTNCLSLFEYLLELALKGLRFCQTSMMKLVCKNNQRLKRTFKIS